MWCRCRACDRAFKAATDAVICPRCRRLEERALRQAAEMIPPALEERKWSTPWMQERLGTNSKDDT